MRISGTPKFPVLFIHESIQVEMCFICEPDAANIKSFIINHCENLVRKVKPLSHNFYGYGLMTLDFIESQLEELNSTDSEKKSENVKLQKDRDHLESRLAASERMLHEMKNQLSLLRKKSVEERRKRAQSAMKVSEGIAMERENLVMELHHL
ncbi:hypothetical protein AVEN_32487-1, partial [Araneus ventricosus]